MGMGSGLGLGLVAGVYQREPFVSVTRVVVRKGKAARARARAAEPGSARQLRRWCLHPRWDVRRAVALNPSCPAHLLRLLHADKVWAVRAAVAAAPGAPEEVSVRLAGDVVAPVRLALAGNPSATPEVLVALLESRDGFVPGKAIGHPAVPPDVLVGYAQGLTGPAWVLRRVAGNPACPASLSAEIRTRLAGGDVDEGDPEFDPDLCTSHPGGADVTESTWYRHQAAEAAAPHLHPLWRVRQEVTAAGSSTPFAVLHVLARDPREEVRQTTAGFAGMDQRILRELAYDADRAVANRATATLERRPAMLRDRPAPGVSRRRRTVVAVVSVGLSVFGTAVIRGCQDPDPDSPSVVPAVVRDPVGTSTVENRPGAAATRPLL